MISPTHSVTFGRTAIRGNKLDFSGTMRWTEDALLYQGIPVVYSEERNKHRFFNRYDGVLTLDGDKEKEQYMVKEFLIEASYLFESFVRRPLVIQSDVLNESDIESLKEEVQRITPEHRFDLNKLDIRFEALA